MKKAKCKCGFTVLQAVNAATMALLLLTITNLQIFAQNFAPIGTQWCYHGDITAYSSVEVGASNYKWTDRLSVEKDTLIGGINCRKVNAIRHARRSVNPDSLYQEKSATYYFYDNADTVFVYSESLAGFVPLYILSSQENDTVCLPVPVPEFTEGITSYCYIVDSIRTELFDNVPLKSFYTRTISPDTGLYSVNFGRFSETEQGIDFAGPQFGKFTERIGGSWPNISGIFPFAAFRNWVGGLAIPFPSGTLSYYSDPSITLQLTSHSCDTVFLPVAIQDNSVGRLNLSLSPNPTPGEVVIHFAAPIPYDGTIILKDYTGRRLRNLQIKKGTQDQRLQLAGVLPGIYLLELSTKGGKSIHKLMVSK